MWQQLSVSRTASRLCMRMAVLLHTPGVEVCNATAERRAGKNIVNILVYASHGDKQVRQQQKCPRQSTALSSTAAMLTLFRR